MKIIHQVVLIFGIFILFMWGIGSYSIKVSEDALKTAIDQESEAHTEAMMRSIDNKIYNRIDIFREYTRDLIFQKSIQKANRSSHRTEFNSEELEEELEEKMEYYEETYGYPVYFAVTVVDISGNRVAHTGIEPKNHSVTNEWWKNTKEEKIVTYGIVNDPALNISYFQAAFPVLGEKDERLGAVLLSINIHDIIQPLFRYDTGKHKEHRTMNYILSDKKGNTIFSDSHEEKEATAHLGHAHTKDILKGAEESSTYLVRALSNGFMEYKGERWTLSISHDLNEIYKPIQTMRNTILISIFFVSIIALLGILIVSRTAIRPLRILRDTAEKIGKGDLSVKIDTSLKGEVGELLKTFNWMVKKLKKSKENLEENQEKLKSITDSAQDAIIMIDNNGKIIFCNPSTTTIFGYTQDELLGEDLHKLLIEEQYFDAYDDGFKKLQLSGEDAVAGKTVELKAKRKDLQEFPIELSLAAVKKGDKWHAIGIARDITERKNSEMEIKQKDEMMLAQSRQAAMGDMIAMIAHQWRQPLTTIGMVANNILLDIELDNELDTGIMTERMRLVSKQTQHLSKTIDDFRNFFKPNKAKEKTVVADVLKNTLEIIGKSLENNNIELKSDIDENLESEIFPNELMQVFINIINNAKDAIKINEIKEAKMDIALYAKNDYIHIDICDNAGGIPENVIRRMGEPYFTTKEENGTGLGLYMSKTIVEKHLDGKLLWENRNGGACFTIMLPCFK